MNILPIPRCSPEELERDFLRMLVARLADTKNIYRSERDLEAIKRFNQAHSQDKTTISVKDLAVAQYLELNPKSKETLIIT